MKILSIIAGTSVDGPGLRTSIYMAGCAHHCPGCQNPSSWDAGTGTEMTIEEILARVEEEDFDVTLSGGDPMFHPADTLELLKALRGNGRNVWVYTGYTFEQLLADPSRRPLLDYIDVLVDGRFEQAQRSTTHCFRGSTNQRLVIPSRSTVENVVCFEC